MYKTVVILPNKPWYESFINGKFGKSQQRETSVVNFGTSTTLKRIQDHMKEFSTESQEKLLGDLIKGVRGSDGTKNQEEELKKQVLRLTDLINDMNANVNKSLQTNQ